MSSQQYAHNEELIGILSDMLAPKHASDPYVLKFIEYYLLYKNVKDAAKAANITLADGKNLFNRTDIYACIQKLITQDVVKFGYDAEQVVARVKEIAELDMIDACDGSGKFLENLHDWPPEIRRSIKKIRMKNYFEDDANGVPQYKGKVLDVEFHDKMKGLEMMSREKDVFKKTTVVEHEIGKNARMHLLDSAKLAEQAVLAHEPKDVTPVIDVTASQQTGPKRSTVFG